MMACMIRSFRDTETERLFRRERGSKPARPLQRAALRKLLLLDAAESLDDLRVPPGNRLEKLAGGRAGQHSIRVNDQFRVCFRWEGGEAHDVEIVDYH
jgi:proteic killer suppression protein